MLNETNTTLNVETSRQHSNQPISYSSHINTQHPAASTMDDENVVPSTVRILNTSNLLNTMTAFPSDSLPLPKASDTFILSPIEAIKTIESSIEAPPQNVPLPTPTLNFESEIEYKIDNDVFLESLLSKFSHSTTIALSSSSLGLHQNISNDIAAQACLRHSINTAVLPSQPPHSSGSMVSYARSTLASIKLATTETFLSDLSSDSGSDSAESNHSASVKTFHEVYNDPLWFEKDPSISAMMKAKFKLAAPPGLERPCSALLHLLSRTCEEGANTAALLLGLRGEGKSTTLRWALAELYHRIQINAHGTSALPFVLIVLSGAQICDDKIAIVEAVNQTCKQLMLSNPIPSEASFLEHAKFLALLATNASKEGLIARSTASLSSSSNTASFPSIPATAQISTEEGSEPSVTTGSTFTLLPHSSVYVGMNGNRGTSKPLRSRGLPFIFVLDEFQEFAARGSSHAGTVGKQPLLYFLCDMLQGAFCPTSLIALTSSLSAYDLLEKRIRSRLPLRTILFPHALSSEHAVEDFASYLCTPSSELIHRAELHQQKRRRLNTDSNENNNNNTTESISQVSSFSISHDLVGRSLLTQALLLSVRASLQNANVKRHIISFCIFSGHSVQWFASLTLLALLVSVRCKSPGPNALLSSLMPYLKEIVKSNALSSKNEKSSASTATATLSRNSDHAISVGYASGAASPFRSTTSLAHLSAHHVSRIAPQRRSASSESITKAKAGNKLLLSTTQANTSSSTAVSAYASTFTSATDVLRNIIHGGFFSYATRLQNIPFVRNKQGRQHNSTGGLGAGMSMGTGADAEDDGSQSFQSFQLSHGPISALSTPVLKRKGWLPLNSATPVRNDQRSDLLSGLQTPLHAQQSLLQLNSHSTPSQTPFLGPRSRLFGEIRGTAPSTPLRASSIMTDMSYGAPGTPQTPQKLPKSSPSESPMVDGLWGTLEEFVENQPSLSSSDSTNTTNRGTVNRKKSTVFTQTREKERRDMIVARPPLTIGPEDFWAANAILVGYPRWLHVRGQVLKSLRVTAVEGKAKTKTKSKKNDVAENQGKATAEGMSLLGQEPLNPPSPATLLLRDLTILELALVASMLQLEKKNVIPYSFELVFFEYSQYMTRPMFAHQSSEVAPFAFPKAVCLKAFQSLLDLGIAVFVLKPSEQAAQHAISGMSQNDSMLERLFSGTTEADKLKAKQQRAQKVVAQLDIHIKTGAEENDEENQKNKDNENSKVSAFNALFGTSESSEDKEKNGTVGSGATSIFISEAGEEATFGALENVEEGISIIRASTMDKIGAPNYELVRLALDPRECKEFLIKDATSSNIPTWLVQWAQSQAHAFAH